jgi:hypothetical protein
MSGFNEREEGFEKRHALEEELRFKTLARRNKQLGLWVAEHLGLTGAAASDYAKSLVAAQVGQDDDEALARSIGEALAKAQPELSAHRIRRKIEETTAQATREISEGR